MKLIKVKTTRRADKSVDEVIGDFVGYARKFGKQFGKFNVTFLTTFSDRKVVGWIGGDNAGIGGMTIPKAKEFLKQLKEDYENCKKAIEFATKTEKELQGNLQQVIKEAEASQK